MFAKSVLVTGCNRGIGLGLVKQLAGQTQHLFATCREPDEAHELRKVAEGHNHIIVLKLDVTNEKDIRTVVATIAEIVGDSGLNCVINNAGKNHKDTLEVVSSEVLEKLYAINAIGPAMLVKACLPLLKKASALCIDSNMSVSRASILNISSIRGSFTDNTTARNYAYRMSKTALNMLTKSLSVELRSDCVLVVSISPGWVQTAIGGPKALISNTESADGIIKVASDFTEKYTGTFYGWDGENMPW